jgi:hypothetical protein
MKFSDTCKNANDPWTQEEKYVLGIVQPDEFTEAILTAIRIAMSQGDKKMAHVVQLAKVYPELVHAMNCLLNGNLQEVYRAHKCKQAELLKSLGY